jgi:cytochrome bd-type quinol oxidase subunit 2
MPRTSPFMRATYCATIATPLCGMAMWLYPGGTYLDEDTQGYSVTHNFFGDLGRTVSIGGDPNQLGSLFYVLCLLTLLVGFGGALIAFARLYASEPRARTYARLAGGTSALMCVCFLGMATTGDDGLHDLYIAFMYTGLRIFPVATLCFAIAAARAGAPRGIRITWILLTLVLVAYVPTMSFGPAERTETLLVYLVMTQKLTVVISGAFLGSLCEQTERALTWQGDEASAPGEP